MTRKLQDYITESEAWIDSPAAGDDFAINIREECLVESHIVDVTEDGVVLAADDRMIEILESYGMLDEALLRPDNPIAQSLRGMRQGAKDMQAGMTTAVGSIGGAGGAAAGTALATGGGSTALFLPALGAGLAAGAALWLGGKLTIKALEWLARKVFGSKEQALEFAKAHLAAAEQGAKSFEWNGKTYPVKVTNPQQIEKLKSEIFDLKVYTQENLDARRRGVKSLSSAAGFGSVSVDMPATNRRDGNQQAMDFYSQEVDRLSRQAEPEFEQWLESAKAKLVAAKQNHKDVEYLARVLSAQQVKKFGGQVLGQRYGNIMAGKRDAFFTPEIKDIMDTEIAGIGLHDNQDDLLDQLDYIRSGWSNMSAEAKQELADKVGYTVDQLEQVVKTGQLPEESTDVVREMHKPVNRAVDSRGRTQQQWLKAVTSKFPDARIIQAKMIDGPMHAFLPNGKKISWIKVEQQDVAEAFMGYEIRRVPNLKISYEDSQELKRLISVITERLAHMPHSDPIDENNWRALVTAKNSILSILQKNGLQESDIRQPIDNMSQGVAEGSQELRRIQELAGMTPSAPVVDEAHGSNWVDDLYYEFNERYDLPRDIDDDAYLDIVTKFLNSQGIDPDKIEDLGELFIDMRDHEEDDDHDYADQLDAEQYDDEDTMEAKYQGREVPLGKPMQGDVKKFKVYVKDPKTGNIKKVNFGDKTMRIKKSNPARRKSFRARHNCANPGPRTKARYWSCRKW